MTDEQTTGHAPEIQGNETPEVTRKAARETTAGTPVSARGASSRPPRTPGATPELAHRIEAPTPLAPLAARPARPPAAATSALDATRRAWLRALDVYEEGVLTYADYEDRLADRAPLPLVAQVVCAQAELRRRTLRTSTRPARALLER